MVNKVYPPPLFAKGFIIKPAHQIIDPSTGEAQIGQSGGLGAPSPTKLGSSSLVTVLALCQPLSLSWSFSLTHEPVTGGRGAQV